MRKKLDVTAHEMHMLREQGFTNKEIAEQLEISYGTVFNYIGKQGKRKQITPKRPVVPSQTEVPQITVVNRVVSIDGYLFELSNLQSCVTVSLADGQALKIPSNEIEKLASALTVVKDYMKQI